MKQDMSFKINTGNRWLMLTLSTLSVYLHLRITIQFAATTIDLALRLHDPVAKEQKPKL